MKKMTETTSAACLPRLLGVATPYHSPPHTRARARTRNLVVGVVGAVTIRSLNIMAFLKRVFLIFLLLVPV